MFDVRRQKCRWGDESDLRAKHRESLDVAARHARVLNVADDCQLEAFESLDSEGFAHGETIDKRLRRVLMRAVAGIYDRRASPGAHLPRHPSGLVPDNESVDSHVANCLDSVAQALAFANA